MVSEAINSSASATAIAREDEERMPCKLVDQGMLAWGRLVIDWRRWCVQ